MLRYWKIKLFTTCEQLDDRPSPDCELGEPEFPRKALSSTDPVDADPPEVLFPSPFELPHGFPSLTKTGTATRRGELY